MWNANVRWLALAGLIVAAGAGAACTKESTDKAKADTGAAVDATKTEAGKVMDATKKAGEKALDATKEAASAAGDAVTDTWITTKVKAKFADEKILNGANIKVETTDHLVTLTGTVPSAAAKTRAGEIARGTEKVTRVVDNLTVAGV
jgi:osmotically-inducible protein OsmY